MSTDQETEIARPGASALLLGQDQKTSDPQLKPGAEFHTHRGTMVHDDQSRSPCGTQIGIRIGEPLILLYSSIDETVRNPRWRIQIVYPRNTGYIQ